MHTTLILTVTTDVEATDTLHYEQQRDTLVRQIEGLNTFVDIEQEIEIL